MYEGYEASSHGNIRSVDKIGVRGMGVNKLRKGKVLKQRESATGYLRVNIMVEGKHKTVSSHRIVCSAFHGAPPYEKAQVNHKDGNKKNNKPDNLEWCTGAENQRHAIDTGLKVSPVGMESKITKYAYIGESCAGHKVILIGKKAIYENGFDQAGVWRSEKLGRFHRGYKFIRIPIEELAQYDIESNQ